MLQQRTSIWRHFDLWLTAAVILLTVYGILMIRSAVTGAPAFEDLPQRQAAFAIVAAVILVAISALDYRILTSSHWYIYIGLVLALILVLIVGTIGNASRRWFDLGFINLQPSEIGRILLAVTFAQFLAQRQQFIGRFSNTLLALVYVGIPIAFIFIKADLGMSLLYLVMWFVMIFMAGLPVTHFGALARRRHSNCHSRRAVSGRISESPPDRFRRSGSSAGASFQYSASSDQYWHRRLIRPRLLAGTPEPVGLSACAAYRLHFLGDHP